MRQAERLIEAFLDPTYMIREVPVRGADLAFEIAKFAGGKEPSAVYEVLKIGRKWICDCPGFRKGHSSGPRHKHIRLVQEWIKRGKPDPIMTPGFQDWVEKILKR